VRHSLPERQEVRGRSIRYVRSREGWAPTVPAFYVRSREGRRRLFRHLRARIHTKATAALRLRHKMSRPIGSTSSSSATDKAAIRQEAKGSPGFRTSAK
jgi:hypothetical protein